MGSTHKCPLPNKQQFDRTRCLRVRSGSRGSCHGRSPQDLAQQLVRVARVSTSAFSGETTAFFPGTVTTTWRLLVRLSKRIRERGGGRQSAWSNGDVQRGVDRAPCLQKIVKITAWCLRSTTVTRGIQGNVYLLSSPSLHSDCGVNVQSGSAVLWSMFQLHSSFNFVLQFMEP